MERLLENIRRSYRGMLHDVRKRKSNTSKLDKLYKLFHKSTIGEGIQLCSLCERELGIGEVPQTLWQLLLEKEFISFLQSELSTSSGSPEPPRSLRVLTEIEKNAVRYTAGYVVRKLEEKYFRRKTKAAEECVAALQEMGGKLHHQPSGDELDQSSSNKWSQLVIAEDCTLFRMRYSICSSHFMDKEFKALNFLSINLTSSVHLLK